MIKATFDGIKGLLEVLPQRTKGPGMVISMTVFIAATFLLYSSIPALIESDGVAWVGTLLLAFMGFAGFLVWINTRPLTQSGDAPSQPPVLPSPDEKNSEPIPVEESTGTDS